MAVTSPPPKPPQDQYGVEKRYRLLALVRQEGVTRVDKEPEDTVDAWPHLVSLEFIAAAFITILVIFFSVFYNAPLLGQADPNVAENPAKAPWYFLGLQELLHYFPPVVAGVLLPTFVLLGLALIPYIDRNPSTRPQDRKLAICLFSLFIVSSLILTLVGVAFRGPGYSWTWPWNGIFFSL
ncbi:MAG: menaquinol oxidoreductase [Chloroflexota bacterium]